MFRSSNRIEGKIMSNDLEKRIQDLEKTSATQAKLVEQITAHLFAPKKSKADKPVS